MADVVWCVRCCYRVVLTHTDSDATSFCDCPSVNIYQQED